jgi:hypothetical protein
MALNKSNVATALKIVMNLSPLQMAGNLTQLSDYQLLMHSFRLHAMTHLWNGSGCSVQSYCNTVRRIYKLDSVGVQEAR